MEETETPPSIKLVQITKDPDTAVTSSSQPGVKKQHENVVVKVATTPQVDTNGGATSKIPPVQVPVGATPESEKVAVKIQPRPSKLIGIKVVQKVARKAVPVNLQIDQSKITSTKNLPQNVALKVVSATNSDEGKERILNLSRQNPSGMKIVTAPIRTTPVKLVKPSQESSAGVKIITTPDLTQVKPLVNISLDSEKKTVAPPPLARNSAQEVGTVSTTKHSPMEETAEVQERTGVKIVTSPSENSKIKVIQAPKSADAVIIKKLAETVGVRVMGTADGSGGYKTISSPAQGKIKKITLGRNELESVGLKVVSSGTGGVATGKDHSGKISVITASSPQSNASEKVDKENISLKMSTSSAKDELSDKVTSEARNKLKVIEKDGSKKPPTKVVATPQIRCKVMTKGVAESVVLKTVAIKMEEPSKTSRDGTVAGSFVQNDKISRHSDDNIVASLAQKLDVKAAGNRSSNDDGDDTTREGAANAGRKRPLSGERTGPKIPPLTKMVTRRTARESGKSLVGRLPDTSKSGKGSSSNERASLKSGGMAGADKSKRAKVGAVERTREVVDAPAAVVKQEPPEEGDSDASYLADDPEEFVDDEIGKRGLEEEEEEEEEEEDVSFGNDTDTESGLPAAKAAAAAAAAAGTAKRRKRRGRKRLLHTKKSFRRANYQCEHCDTVCSGKRTLRAHMITHVGAKPFKCNICGATFTLAGNLKTHTMIHTGERPHKCNECGAAFVQAVTLRNHMLTHTGEKPYECPHCHAAFSQAYYLKLHVMTHTGERPHKCKQCDAAFIQSSALKQHMLIHTGEKPHQCEHCDATFRHVNSLKVHYISHTGEKKYKCNYCEMSFSYGGQLKKHLRVHTGENPYKCTKCKATFTSSKKRKEHILQHKDIKLHKCTLCDDAFMSSAILENHIATHLKEKSYECEQCDAEFARADSLNKHMSKHDPTKDQQCRECDKMFLTVADLKAHAKMHTSQTFARFKESSHRCHLCDAVYIRAENLHRHLAKHDTDTDHKCPHCGKSFLLKSDLKIHFMTHTNAKMAEKPHKCTHCDEIFIRPSDLRTHIKSHVRIVEKEKRYHCKYCNAGYTRINNYRMHVMKHAGEKAPAKKMKRKRRRKLGEVERSIIQLTQENEELMQKLVQAVEWTSPP